MNRVNGKEREGTESGGRRSKEGRSKEARGMCQPMWYPKRIL